MTDRDRSSVLSFLKMVEDFGNMGTGRFIANYPDCKSFEGYLYVQRKGAALRKALTRVTRHD